MNSFASPIGLYLTVNVVQVAASRFVYSVHKFIHILLKQVRASQGALVKKLNFTATAHSFPSLILLHVPLPISSISYALPVSAQCITLNVTSYFILYKDNSTFCTVWQLDNQKYGGCFSADQIKIIQQLDIKERLASSQLRILMLEQGQYYLTVCIGYYDIFWLMKSIFIFLVGEYFCRLATKIKSVSYLLAEFRYFLLSYG